MEQITTNQIHLFEERNDAIRQRVENSLAFLREAAEERISRCYYSKLSFDVERFLRDVYTAIADIPNQREAYELFGNLLCQFLIARGTLRQELSLHEVTRDLVIRDVSGKRKQFTNSAGYYRVRTLKQEFGEAITSIRGSYKRWEAIPGHVTNRAVMNLEINQLLRQKDSVSNFLKKRLKMGARYKYFLDEMERRIIDCRHVLMITELTDCSSKRKRKAFDYLYEALQYRKELKNAVAVFHQICNQKAV